MKHRTTSISIGVALSVLLTFVLSTVAFSKTIYVDDDARYIGLGTSSNPYPTIQRAINRAATGDIVRVLPGTYRERITLKDGVDVHGSSAKGGSVIDGNNSGEEEEPRGSVVTAIDVGSDTTFEGFKIIRGKSETGNGMYIENSSLRIYGCTFENNQFARAIPTFSTSPSCHGGAIYMTHSSPVIENCIFRNNISRFGGAISMGSNSNPEIYGCVFDSNSAQLATSNLPGGGGFAYGSGGAIDIAADCRPIITECDFLNNWVIEGDGGAISVGSRSTVTVEGCVFDGNYVTGGYGGAMFCTDPHENVRNKPFVRVSNSIFWRNRSPFGSGIVADGPSAVTVIHCTFYENMLAGTRNIGSALHSMGDDSGIVVLNSIIWGNERPQTATEYGGLLFVYASDVQGGHSGYGNIDRDPMFVDEENGDFHLRSHSPCIDAGFNYGSYLEPASDIDGDTRVLDGDRDGRSYPDMGVDERNPYTSVYQRLPF